MVKRVVLGAQSDGTYGLRCSQPGYDASSNPVDFSQLSFASDWNTVVPAYLSGASLNIANGATLSVPFTSIGYIPLGFYMVRKNGDTGWNSLPPPYSAGQTILAVVTYIDHILIVNKLGYAIDVAYSLFYVVTQ
jgi:hypothetical protein